MDCSVSQCWESQVFRINMNISLFTKCEISGIGSILASKSSIAFGIHTQAILDKTKMKKKNSPSWSRMFPCLHQDVTSAVSEYLTTLRFETNNTPVGVRKEYSTFVKGLFLCHTRGCSRNAWKSGQVAILIRIYYDGSYNAEVFKQRCEACKKLGTLKLDRQSYVERVSYRLLKWSGVDMERPHYGPREGPPHKSALCEGCKRGKCREAGL